MRIQTNYGKEDTYTLIPTIVYQWLDWGFMKPEREKLNHIKHTFFLKFLRYWVGITFNINEE